MTKLFKKPLSLVLCFLMLFSTVIPVFGATSTNDYETHWAKETIKSALTSGYIEGYPDGSFKPDKAINRAEFFAMVNSVFNFTTTTDSTYTDVSDDVWYAPVIAKAKAAGYIVGYPDGSIHPKGYISRQEVAVIISRLKSLVAKSNDLTYTDAASVSSWSKQAIIGTAEAFIMIGYPDGSFKPAAQITRAEALVAITKCYNYITAVPLIEVPVVVVPGEDGPTSNPPVSSPPVSNPPTSNPPTNNTVAVSDLDVTQPTMTLTVGGATGTIIPIFTPTNATNKNIIWTSSDPTVATVNASGVVTPIAEGTATITATSVADTTKTATTDVTVTTGALVSVSPLAVELGLAGDFAILAKTAISNISTSAITGNIGVSPAALTYITGFSLTQDSTQTFSTTTEVIGKVYAADSAVPTPDYLTTAISNMETAYDVAAGRDVDYTNLHSGDLSGQTLTRGVYKWGTGVSINSNVTLNGSATDVWIFQIAGGITQASSTNIILTGGAQAKNIFWQSADTVAIGTGAHFEGNVISMTNITLATGSSINGRLLAQTAVTLDQATVTKPE